jgi:hypothetical protein
MDEQTSPFFFEEETFWFCGVLFLKKSLKHSSSTINQNDEAAIAEAQLLIADGDVSSQSEGAITIVFKNGSDLAPMDTFSGKALIYVCQ